MEALERMLRPPFYQNRRIQLITCVTFSSSFCLSASDDTLSGDDDIDFPGPEDIFFSSSDASEEDIVRFRSIIRGGRRLSRFTYCFVGMSLALDATVAER